MHCSAVTVFLLMTLSFFVCVTCNRASPPQKVIRLDLAASKASYMSSLLQGNLFPLGYIKENSGTTPKFLTMLTGTLANLMPKPNLFSILPPQIYNPFLDKRACSIGLWAAVVRVSKDSQVIMLRNSIHRVVVFGFCGTKAYNVKALQEDFIAQTKSVNITGKTFSVHKRILEHYNNISSWFEAKYRKVPQDYTVILTGYDIGGSQAFIAALIATLKIGRRPDAVVAFGAPPVGGLEFYDHYRNLVGCSRTVSIAVIQDIFTRFPLGVVRPCEDTPVDSGRRQEDVISDHLKSLFVKNLPTIIPQILNFVLPAGPKKILNDTFPVKKQQEMLGKMVGTVDKAFDTMLDLENAHDLYRGYDHGIAKAYKGELIDYGCDRKF